MPDDDDAIWLLPASPGIRKLRTMAGEVRVSPTGRYLAFDPRGEEDWHHHRAPRLVCAEASSGREVAAYDAPGGFCAFEWAAADSLLVMHAADGIVTLAHHHVTGGRELARWSLALPDCEAAELQVSRDGRVVVVRPVVRVPARHAYLLRLPGLDPLWTIDVAALDPAPARLAAEWGFGGGPYPRPDGAEIAIDYSGSAGTSAPARLVVLPTPLADPGAPAVTVGFEAPAVGSARWLGRDTIALFSEDCYAFALCVRSAGPGTGFTVTRLPAPMGELDQAPYEFVQYGVSSDDRHLAVLRHADPSRGPATLHVFDARTQREIGSAVAPWEGGVRPAPPVWLGELGRVALLVDAAEGEAVGVWEVTESGPGVHGALALPPGYFNALPRWTPAGLVLGGIGILGPGDSGRPPLLIDPEALARSTDGVGLVGPVARDAAAFDAVSTRGRVLGAFKRVRSLGRGWRAGAVEDPEAARFDPDAPGAAEAPGVLLCALGGFERAFDAGGALEHALEFRWHASEWHGGWCRIQCAFAAEGLAPLFDAGSGRAVLSPGMEGRRADLVRLVAAASALCRAGYFVRGALAETTSSCWEDAREELRGREERVVFWNQQSHRSAFGPSGELRGALHVRWAGDREEVAAALRASGLRVDAPESADGTFVVRPAEAP